MGASPTTSGSRETSDAERGSLQVAADPAPAAEADLQTAKLSTGGGEKEATRQTLLQRAGLESRADALDAISIMFKTFAGQQVQYSRPNAAGAAKEEQTGAAKTEPPPSQPSTPPPGVSSSTKKDEEVVSTAHQSSASSASET